jgi:hypothetical protein
MFVFLLSLLAASERQFLQAYTAPLGYPRSPVAPEDIGELEADGRVWLAKAYGQNYESFNQLRGDSSAFMYDAQTQSYVPVVTHNGVPKELAGYDHRPRSSWWSRIFFVAFGVLAFAKRTKLATNVVPLMRYALAF